MNDCQTVNVPKDRYWRLIKKNQRQNKEQKTLCHLWNVLNNWLRNSGRKDRCQLKMNSQMYRRKTKQMNSDVQTADKDPSFNLHANTCV